MLPANLLWLKLLLIGQTYGDVSNFADNQDSIEEGMKQWHSRTNLLLLRCRFEARFASCEPFHSIA